MLTAEHYWQSPYIDWVDTVPEDWALLVFYIRPARYKAIVPAVVEALSLLRSLNPVASLSGPLADRKGVFWVGIEKTLVSECVRLLGRLGYTFAVDQAVHHSLGETTDSQSVEANGTNLVRWHGEYFRLRRLYEEDPRFMRDRAPDRREFLLEDMHGNIVEVKGYRGNSHPLSRRGLPVADARMLVNLVTPVPDGSFPGKFLDPFAGAGGIVTEAAEAGYEVYSLDTDLRLRYGLRRVAALHVVGDATALPFATNTFSSIATEPPYHRRIKDQLRVAFAEIYRVLQIGGRLSMLVSPWQVDPLLREASRLAMKVFLASPINRKGTPVAVLGWTKWK